LEGNLKDDAKEKYEDKYSDLDYLSEQISENEPDEDE
jgi:hypothetical protein